MPECLQLPMDPTIILANAKYSCYKQKLSTEERTSMKKIILLKAALLLVFSANAHAQEGDVNSTELSSNARILAGAKGAAFLSLGLLLTVSGLYTGVFSFCDDGAADFPKTLRTVNGDLILHLVLYSPASLVSLAFAGTSFFSAFKNIKLAVKGKSSLENCAHEQISVVQQNTVSI